MLVQDYKGNTDAWLKQPPLTMWEGTSREKAQHTDWLQALAGLGVAQQSIAHLNHTALSR